MADKNDIIYYITDVLRKENVEESKGVIILKDGKTINIERNFDIFFNSYNLLHQALGTKDEKIIDKTTNELNNGVISVGNLSIDLTDVSVMMKINQTHYPGDTEENDIPFDDMTNKSKYN